MENLFEKGCGCFGGGGSPDFDIVNPADVVEGAETDESLFEGNVVGDHDGSEHVVEVESDSTLCGISNNADFTPYFDTPINADRAEISDRSSGGFVYHENIVSVVVAGLGDVDVHVMRRVFEAEEEAIVAVSVTTGLGRVGVLFHELGDGRAFDSALLYVDVHDEIAESKSFDEGDVVGRAMRGLVVALAFESEDGASVFLKKIPSRAVGNHKAIERLLGLEVLLVLQGIAVG